MNVHAIIWPQTDHVDLAKKAAKTEKKNVHSHVILLTKDEVAKDCMLVQFKDVVQVLDL